MLTPTRAAAAPFPRARSITPLVSVFIQDLPVTVEKLL
jgi:hypothetical protein